MGKSTQKVDKGEQLAPVAASSQQPVASSLQKNADILLIFYIYYRVSTVTFGTFPVYKRFKNMGKSTQKVDKGDIVSN